MPAGALSRIVEHLRHAGVGRDGAGLGDAHLLERFLTTGEETAFEALVRRHGPMVLNVCRRMLHNVHDADDAFQAVFLVLIRKARSIRSKESIASWLYGVAYQVALKARAVSAKRQAREKQVHPMPEPADASHDRDSLQQLLDHELSRLPDRYRIPIILCDLEGKSRREAAAQLQLPEGTLSSRLTRGRAALAARLSRHGLACTGVALTTSLATHAATCVPPSLVACTVEAARSLISGQAAAVSAAALALAEGALKAMLFLKLKKVTAALLLFGVFAFSYGMLAARAADGQGEAAPVPAQMPVAEANDPPAPEQVSAPPQATVTLTLVRVRGLEFYSVHAEGEFKGKKVRTVIFACDLVLDNNTGEELTVQTSFFSPYDGLSLLLLKDGKQHAEQSYVHHQSPASFEKESYILKKGKNQAQLRIPIGPVPETWPRLEAKLVGTLPGSKFKGRLESSAVKVERVESFDPPTKKKAPLDEAETSRIIKELERLGAHSTRDDKRPGRPVIRVDMRRLFALAVTDETVNLLAKLTELRALELGGREITDADLQKLAVLDNLRLINLGGASITDEGLKELQRLPRLEDAWLAGTQITDNGLKHLGQIKSLRMLGFHETAVGDAGLEALNGLDDLDGLWLSRSQVTDRGLRHLHAFPKLQKLYIGDTKITDEGFKTVGTLPSLRLLYAHGTAVTDAGLAHIARMKNLNLLNLASTRVTDAGVRRLAPLNKLIFLHLGQTHLTDQSLGTIAALSDLQELHLNHTKITDRGLAALERLPALRILDVAGTSVTAPAIEAFKKKMPKCNIQR